MYRSYRRSMNGSFSMFKAATQPLEQVRAMTGPPADDIRALSKRLAGADRKIAKIMPPEELAASHALVRSAWELAQNAFRLRLQAVSGNNVIGAQQASSAAAGALMLVSQGPRRSANGAWRSRRRSDHAAPHPAVAMRRTWPAFERG